MTKITRRQMSIGYFARTVVQDGIAKGKSLNAIRAELRYVCEYSEVLGQSDVEVIIEVGTGMRAA